MTLESADESSSDVVSRPQKLRAKKADEAQLDPAFTFDISGDPYSDLLQGAKFTDIVKSGSRPDPISVDVIIARRRFGDSSVKRKSREGSDGIEDPSDWGSSVLEGDEDEEGQSSDDALATSGSESENDGSPEEEESEFEGTGSSSGDNSASDTEVQKARKKAFFSSDAPSTEQHSSFLTMNLSRPVLKALTSLGFHTPTPIQIATIPVGLLGKDVVGNAVTGSGKTAAFIIPMIERLLYRDRGKKSAATRCLILVPTRELAVQCYDVGKKLATHTDIQFCLVVGGLSLKSQEFALRARPDVIIATPGRLIDHLRNSPAFTLDALDILVLDEADRMLSDGFADELSEIIKACPLSRQTMLFSATMTDSVDELVKMSLNKPVRLFVDPKRSVARGLVQEFVRVRAGKEADRSALLLALCTRTFKSGVIVFLRSKKLAHQLRILFGLLGLPCEELHGNLTQEQRLKALQLFRDGQTVINYDMPAQLAQYLHRVGRTARAGRKGRFLRSVTLVGEADRKVLKAAIKRAADEDQVRHRTIPSEMVEKWARKLESLKDEVAGVLREEKEEKQLRQAEMEVKKGQNMLEYEAEIYSRPARTWFQNGRDKQHSEALSKEQYESNFQKDKTMNQKPRRDKFSGLTRRAKRRKLALEEETNENGGAADAAIRSAKKAARATKIGIPNRSISRRGGLKQKKKRKSGGLSEAGSRVSRREGIHAKRGDVAKIKIKANA
ncbi:P-loop containing nucleoside triphosphate hydrolase protein [Multifurca ochricompacta]|uniref:RNA helicase n=1 Tax=Multifurca ochricompacta TaxID=376703 RepID=A0AAD4QQA5_9AGAM|nr:P-loop containing nucleoside triphosphate hydrolase protein [Multifurca ochricompacta]